jgi:S1-C subfamily serine protease
LFVVTGVHHHSVSMLARRRPFGQALVALFRARSTHLVDRSRAADGRRSSPSFLARDPRSTRHPTTGLTGLALIVCVITSRCVGGWPGGIRASLRLRPTPTATEMTVERVEPEGPAARAGLRVGDTVLAIDGVPTADMTEAELRERARGEVGSIVVLRVRSADGALRELRIERGPTQ